MTFALPTILEASSTANSGLQVPDSSGTAFFAKLWRVDGTTAAAYNRTLVSVISGDILRAQWRWHRMGGPGAGVFVFQGGIADLDVAVQGEYELEIVRGGVGVSGTTWYRGRVVRYGIGLDASGKRITSVLTEGYAAKLREIVFTATISAGQTVAQAVATILSTYVTPNTRIRYDAVADVAGTYVLAGDLVFKDADVLSTLHRLAMLQGSTEWALTEGGIAANAAPAFYFKAESSSVSETAVFISGANVKQMETAGTFLGAVNNVTVVGGIVSNAAVTGSSNDATAEAAYGKRYANVVWAALQNSTDANRLAANYVSYYKDGNGSYFACRDNPTTRLEPDRTSNSYGNGGASIPASPKASWFGDSSKLSAHWSTIEYTYEPGCPVHFTACGHGGLFEDTADAILSRISDAVDMHTSMFRQLAAGAGGGAPTDAQYLVLAANGSLSAERVFTPSTGLTATDGGAGAAYTVTADLSTGKAGGQTASGGTASGENLTLQSTTHATKGKVIVGSSAFDEANTRLGINDTTPSAKLDLNGDVALQASTPTQLSADQNNYAFTGGDNTHSFYRLLAVTADRTITGFAGGVDGRVLVLVNVGTIGVHKAIVLADQSGSSSVGNKIYTGVGGNIRIDCLQAAILVYHSAISFWTPVYQPGNFLQGTAAPTQNAPIGTFFWDSTNKHLYVCNTIGAWTLITDGGITVLTGDVTASGPGSVAATIANDAVTYAKMQNVSAASKLLGRGDSGAGDPEEITLGTNLSMSGTTLNAAGGSATPNDRNLILATQVFGF